MCLPNKLRTATAHFVRLFIMQMPTNTGRTHFKKGHTPWNKGVNIQTNTGRTHIKKGATPWNKGKRMGPEIRIKLSLAKLGKTGINSNAWKGGRSRDKHSLTTPAYRHWRNMVFERDSFCCQDCGAHGCQGAYLEAHHIKSWAKHPDLRFEITNGITYCVDCHMKNDKLRARFKKKHAV